MTTMEIAIFMVRHYPPRSRRSRSRRQASSSASTAAGSPLGRWTPVSGVPSILFARSSAMRFLPSPDRVIVSPERSRNSRDRNVRTTPVLHAGNTPSSRHNHAPVL
jgi:hypothetical protein